MVDKQQLWAIRQVGKLKKWECCVDTEPCQLPAMNMFEMFAHLRLGTKKAASVWGWLGRWLQKCRNESPSVH